jgi:hypothetical protein
MVLNSRENNKVPAVLLLQIFPNFFNNCHNFHAVKRLSDDALFNETEMLVESVAFIFRIEIGNGAVVLQKRRYGSAKIQGVA